MCVLQYGRNVSANEIEFNRKNVTVCVKRNVLTGRELVTDDLDAVFQSY